MTMGLPCDREGYDLRMPQCASCGSRGCPSLHRFNGICAAREAVAAPATTRAMIVELMQRYRLTLSDEKLLQVQIGQMLELEKVPFAREVRLSEADIVDFMVGDGALLQPLGQACAIEVKIGGSRRAIFRQIERYCVHQQVAEIVLATNVPMTLPFDVHGKPTAVAHLARGWL